MRHAGERTAAPYHRALDRLAEKSARTRAEVGIAGVSVFLALYGATTWAALATLKGGASVDAQAYSYVAWMGAAGALLVLITPRRPAMGSK